MPIPVDFSIVLTSNDSRMCSLENRQEDCRSSYMEDAVDPNHVELLREEQTRPSSDGCLEMVVVH